MKNRLMRVLALVLLLALAVGVVPAMAATKKASFSNMALYANTGSCCLKLNNWTGDEEVVSITSSNPKVIDFEEDFSFWIIPKKVGSSTITLVYKLNGKEYTIKKKLTVSKYPKPIKSLTINKHRITLKDSAKCRFCFDEVMDKKLSITINLKPAKGWKITKIKAYALKTWSDKGKKSLTVKNNKKFTVPKDREAFVTYALKKGKTKFNYTVSVERAGE